jgi:hypothetical protein
MENALVIDAKLKTDLTATRYLEIAFHTDNYKWPYDLGMGLTSLQESDYP